jgi:flagellin-like protein
MRARSSRARRGVSPVLATLVLMSITISVGAAVAGYSFTLFGHLQTTANVEVVRVTCSVSASDCVLVLRNVGNGVAVVPGPFGCTLYGTTQASSVNGGTGAVGIPPGQDTGMTCQFNTLPQTAIPGIHVSGTITISNGMQIPFFTNWGM